jgi:hypothetical protein
VTDVVPPRFGVVASARAALSPLPVVARRFVPDAKLKALVAEPVRAFVNRPPVDANASDIAHSDSLDAVEHELAAGISAAVPAPESVGAQLPSLQMLQHLQAELAAARQQLMVSNEVESNLRRALSEAGAAKMRLEDEKQLLEARELRERLQVQFYERAAQWAVIQADRPSQEQAALTAAKAAEADANEAKRACDELKGRINALEQVKADLSIKLQEQNDRHEAEMRALQVLMS